MNTMHPETFLLTHRLRNEALERDLLHLAEARAGRRGPGGIRAAVASALRALGLRSRTIVPGTGTLWDERRLRPGPEAPAPTSAFASPPTLAGRT